MEDVRKQEVIMVKKHLILQWHITDICDNKCKHCYVFDKRTYNIKNPTEMSLNLCKEVIKQFKQLTSYLTKITSIAFYPKFNISGGDPLLHSNFFDILTEIKKINAPVEILGNPDHITPEIAKKLKSIGVVQYQLSLDGMEQTHDRIRGKGSFNKTVNGVKVLNESGIASHIMSTVCKENMLELCDQIKFMTEQNCSLFAFARAASYGNAKKLDLNISPKEYRNLLEKVHDLQSNLKLKGYKTKYPLKDNLWKLFLYELGEYKIYPNYKPGKTVDGCHMAQSFMVLLPDGSVFGCRRFYSPIEKFPYKSLSHIFLKNEKMINYRKVKSLEKCSKCDLLYYCRGCPAVAHGAHEDWKNADPQCWKKI